KQKNEKTETIHREIKKKHLRTEIIYSVTAVTFGAYSLYTAENLIYSYILHSKSTLINKAYGNSDSTPHSAGRHRSRRRHNRRTLVSGVAVNLNSGGSAPVVFTEARPETATYLIYFALLNSIRFRSMLKRYPAPSSPAPLS
ncbi:MAG: hypothetical protein LBF85_05605, partial [Tannerella sp.]|nr:hypothetical protein [Tannerella sp.]